MKKKRKSSMKYIIIFLFVFLILLISFISIKKISNLKIEAKNKVEIPEEEREEEIINNIGSEVIAKSDARQNKAYDLDGISNIKGIKIENAKISGSVGDVSIAIDIINTTNETIESQKINLVLLNKKNEKIIKIKGILLGSINAGKMASLDIPTNQDCTGAVSFIIEN